MKLHLPKQLFTALLAALTLATPAAFTFSSAAWGAEVEINNQQLTWDANTDFTNYADQQLRMTNGTSITMSGGDRNIEWLRVHDYYSSTTETFTLSGGTLNVTYADDGESSSSGGAAVVLGHWSSGTGKMEVTGGTLNVLNGTIRMGWDSSSILNISGGEGATSGGVVNAKGIRFLKSTDASDSDTLTLSSGGRLNVGTLGIANSGAYDTKCAVKLNGGTLGALDAAGWTLRNVDTTIGHITIDTNVWDAATGATATGDAAGSANISLLGELTAAEGGMNITLAGNGSITIDHTLDGTVTLAENAGARLYYDASNLNNYDKILSSDMGSTGASGFLQGYQIIGAGSNVAVYAMGSETAVTLTNGAVMLDAATDLYVRDELAYDGTTMGSATHYYIEEGGVFDFTGYSLGTENDATKDVALIGIMNKMSGAGTVKLANGAIIQTGGTRDNVNLSTNYKVAGGASASLTLTSWKHDNMSAWRTWLVGEGGSITVGDNGEGTLNILAGQRLSIEDGGQVSVGTLKLGHDQASDNPGSLVMSGSGSKLTVGGIVMQNGIAGSVLNTVEITGGTLKVTGANAVTYNADNVKTAVTLGGSDAASSVLLQTGTTTGWVMSKQANTASTFNVGYVTIDGTNTQSITFNGATLTGAITNNASLILGEDVVWNSGATVSNNGTLQINKGTGDMVLNNVVGVNAGTYRRAVVTNTAAGNLIIVNTGNKSLSGDITISNGGKVTLKGGTFGTADAAITNNIAAENSTTLVLDGVVAYLNKAGSVDQILDINTELTNGSVMHMLADDRLNWGGSYTTTVGLNSLLDVGSTRQSLSGNALKLAGGTIYGTGGTYPTGNYMAGLDYHASGTITVTENSLIATAVASRDAADVVTLDVAANKTLTIGSYTAGETTNTGSFVGAGKFDKTGDGTVLYKGSAFTNTLDIKAGVFEYYVEDERTHTGSITDSGTTSGDTTAYNGIFKKSGAGTLTLTNATVTKLNVAGGKLVYNSTTDTTHTISGASGTFFEKTGSGSLTANTNNYSGEILVSAGTLKNSAENGNSQKVTVANGATVDLNGKAAYYNLTLQEGATLTNSVTLNSDTGTGKKQLHTITLEGDAKVTGSSELGMVGSGHTTSNLHLNGNTLTKEGTNTFHLFNTTVHSAGLIQINGGTVKADGNASGTLNITKASLAIDGGTFQLGHRSQSIQDLTLTSGSLSIGSGLTLTALGDVTMSSGTVSGNLCLSGTITLTGDGTNTVNLGSAVLSGTSLSGFTQLESARPTTSGLQALTYQLWSGTGSVTSTQTSVSVGGVSYAMDAATGTFTTGGTVYYVATGDTITVGGDSADEGTASATSFVVDGTLDVAASTSTQSITGTAGTVSVANSTTLTLTGTGSSIGTLSAANASVALAAGSTLYLGQTGADAQETTSSIGTVNVASGAGTIYLNEKATLETITKTGEGTLTLNGSGTYTLASVKESAYDNNAIDMTTGVSLSSAWTGKVKVIDSQIMGVNLNSLGNANSSVLLNGLGTWIHTSHKSIDTNLILENYSDTRSAFIITDHSSGNEYKFNGKVSGTGDFELASRAGSAATFIFIGDTSDWSGGIVVNTSFNESPYTSTVNTTPTYTVKLTGGGDVFDPEGADGVSMNRTGTLNLHIGKAGVETRMNGAITKLSNSTLDLTVLGDTVFNKNVTVNSLIGSSEVEISNSAVMNVSKLSGFNGHITVNKIGTGAASLTAAVESGALDMAGLTLNNGATATIKTKITNGHTLGNDISLGDVAVNRGSSLTIHFSGDEMRTATLDTLSIAGTATVEANNYHGQISIGELNSTGTTNELTLKASTPSDSGRTVFNLNDGAFAGTINFVANASNARKIALNINDATVAQDAVINISKSTGSNHQMGLGIGAPQVTVKGIQDGQTVSTAMGIYSGQQAFGNYNDLASDTTFRTLIIDTDGSDNAVSVNSTTSAALGSYLNLEKQGVGSQTFSGNVSAFNGTLNVQGGTLAFTNSGNLDITTATVASDAGLTLGGVTTVGTMSSAGTVTLNSGASLALAAGTAEAQKEHSIGTLTTAAGAGISLGDYATLTLSNMLDTKTDPSSGNAGNADTEASLDLAITGGEGSKLFINLDNSETAQNWQSNNTVRLSALTGDKTVSEVHVSGALAAGVYGGDLKTDLGGARLVLADESTLVVRKDGTYDFGAGAIELEGSTTVRLYGGVTDAGTVISNDISGSKLVAGTGTEGGVTFTGAVELDELVVNVDSAKKVILSGDSEKKLQKVTVNSGKKLEIANGSTLQMTDAEGNTKVSISGTGSSAATLTAKSDSALAQMQEEASFTIQDMTLTNTTITAATPTTQVNLQNVTASNVVLAKGKFAMGETAQVGMSGAGSYDFTTSSLSGITLQNSVADGVSSSTLVVDLGDLSCVTAMGPGKYDLSITLSGFTMQDYTQGIVFAADSWLGQLLTAQGATAYVSGAVETPASVSEGGSTGGVSVIYSAATGGNVGTVITITGLNVPEPATSTLSLLALAALAARRRRK